MVVVTSGLAAAVAAVPAPTVPKGASTVVATATVPAPQVKTGMTVSPV